MAMRIARIFSFGIGILFFLSGLVWAEEAATNDAVRYRLTILTEPAAAKIVIFNSATEYSPGVGLPPGKYNISVSHPGFHEEKGYIEVLNSDWLGKVILRPQQPEDKTAAKSLETEWKRIEQEKLALEDARNRLENDRKKFDLQLESERKKLDQIIADIEAQKKSIIFQQLELAQAQYDIDAQRLEISEKLNRLERDDYSEGGEKSLQFIAKQMAKNAEKSEPQTIALFTQKLDKPLINQLATVEPEDNKLAVVEELPNKLVTVDSQHEQADKVYEDTSEQAPAKLKVSEVHEPEMDTAVGEANSQVGVMEKVGELPDAVAQKLDNQEDEDQQPVEFESADSNKIADSASLATIPTPLESSVSVDRSGAVDISQLVASSTQAPDNPIDSYAKPDDNGKEAQQAVGEAYDNAEFQELLDAVVAELRRYQPKYRRSASKSPVQQQIKALLAKQIETLKNLAPEDPRVQRIQRLYKKRYTVVVGLFSDERRAVKVEDKIRSLGLVAYREPAKTKRGIFHRVAAGLFEDLKQAKEANEILRTHLDVGDTIIRVFSQ